MFEEVVSDEYIDTALVEGRSCSHQRQVLEFGIGCHVRQLVSDKHGRFPAADKSAQFWERSVLIVGYRGSYCLNIVSPDLGKIGLRWIFIGKPNGLGYPSLKVSGEELYIRGGVNKQFLLWILLSSLCCHNHIKTQSPYGTEKSFQVLWEEMGNFRKHQRFGNKLRTLILWDELGYHLDRSLFGAEIQHLEFKGMWSTGESNQLRTMHPHSQTDQEGSFVRQ